MALTTQTMTDEQRKSVALEYLKAFDNGGSTSTAGSILSTAICFSPTTAIFSPHWWPSFLPPTWVRLGSGQGLHPLAGCGLCESVAVLPLGDQDVGVVQ